MTIGVIDYDAGNLKSVETALAHLGYSFFISNKPEEIDKADKIIFPGVGEARSAMGSLRTYGFDTYIPDKVKTGIPFLGICVGSQILLSNSEERDTACLDIVPGKVLRFPDAEGFKVPHMGWNQVKQERPHPIFNGVPNGTSFYFVHSYYTALERQADVIGTCDYIDRFSCAYTVDNIVAVQFHPEKSGRHGLRMLDNFCGGDM